MSGQESGLYQTTPDGATTEPEISELPASNGSTNTKSKSLGRALSRGTTTQTEIVEQAALNGATTPPAVAEEATSSGTTTEESQTKSRCPHRFHLKDKASAPSLPRDPSEGLDYSTDWLDLSRSVIRGKNAKYARALERNLLPNLKVLFLEGNAGDIVIETTLSALRAGHVKGLKKLFLLEVSSYDKITPYEAGTDMLAAALKFGNLPNLNTMDLTGSLPKLVPARGKSKTITDLIQCSWGRGRLLEGRNIFLGCLTPCWIHDPTKSAEVQCLRCLGLSGLVPGLGGLEVYSGDDGIAKIARALRETPIDGLRILILQENCIGDKGASRLAEILEQNSLPNLDKLDLRHNPVGLQGAKNIVHAYLKNPLLTVRVKLDWPNLVQRSKYFAFRDSNIKLEFRLKELGICAKDIVIGEYAEPEHYWSSEREYRLHLQCQAECASYVNEQNFEAHKVTGRRGIKVTSRKIKGDKSQKNLHIDVDLLDLESRGMDKFYIRSSTRFFLPRAKIVIGGRGIQVTSSSKAISAKKILLRNLCRNSLDEEDVDMTDLDHKFYIRSITRFWSKISRNARAVCQQLALPKLQGHPVEELLVLAESDPCEFHAMFGLRQVLLRNPTGSNEGLYSRLWVCTSCFDDYEKSPTVVHPIATNDKLQSAPVRSCEKYFSVYARSFTDRLSEGC